MVWETFTTKLQKFNSSMTFDVAGMKGKVSSRLLLLFIYFLIHDFFSKLITPSHTHTDGWTGICKLVGLDEALLHKGIPRNVGWSWHHDIFVLQSFLRGWVEYLICTVWGKCIYILQSKLERAMVYLCFMKCKILRGLLNLLNVVLTEWN